MDLNKEPINTGRQLTFDLARGLAVLFMVWIHAQEYFLLEEQKESTLGLVIDFLGGAPAAPVFMFLMGVGFVYSRKSQPMLMIKRGILIFGAGYLLSFLRGTLPNLLHFAVTQEPSYATMAASTFFYVDIFQFSGLAMILFGLIKRLELKPMGVVALLTSLVLLNVLLSEVGWVTAPLWLNGVTGLLWGSNNLSFFPFLTWIFYPIVGYLYGQLFIRATAPKRFFRVSGVMSVLVLMAAWFLFEEGVWTVLGDETAYDYYQHALFGNIVFSAFVMAWLCLLNEVSVWLHVGISKNISRWSQHVTPIYFIHWVILGWLVAMMGYNTLSLPYYGVLAVLVFVISDGLAVTYVQTRKK